MYYLAVNQLPQASHSGLSILQALGCSACSSSWTKFAKESSIPKSVVFIAYVFCLDLFLSYQIDLLIRGLSKKRY